MPGDRGEDGPVLICYDGSDGARDAVARAGAVLGSVSYGVVHHSRRRVLIVPPPS